MKKVVNITDSNVLQHKQKEKAKCHEHNDKILELLCNECKCTVCYICCATSHFQHRCLGWADVNEKFCEQIRREIDEGVEDESSYGMLLATLNQIIKELSTNCKQKLGELKLSLTKIKQENNNCFVLIEENIDKCVRDVEDSLLKLQGEGTKRLESIITSLREKQSIQQQTMNNVCHRSLLCFEWPKRVQY